MPFQSDDDGGGGLNDGDRHALNFLDSMDNYILLMDSLSSALRQVSSTNQFPFLIPQLLNLGICCLIRVD